MEILKDFIDYFNNEDYENAYRGFLYISKSDIPISYYYLGLMYKDGLGVKRDIYEAYRYFLLANKHNEPNSQYEIGFMISTYQIESDKEALEYFIKAANSGHVKSMYEIAEYYADSGDDTNASIWYLKASNEGCSDSSNTLASNLAKEGNYVEAIQLYIKSFEQGDKTAALSIADLYNDSNEITYNKDEALNWYLKAATYNDNKALYEVGESYFSKEPTKENINKAVEWYLKASLEHNYLAMFKLGLIFIKGYKVDKDINYGTSFYVDILDANSMPSVYIKDIEKQLEDLYFKNENIDQRYVDKLELLNKARKGCKVSQMEFVKNTIYYTEIYKDELITWLEELSKDNDEALSMLAIEKIFEEHNDVDLLIKSSRKGNFDSQMVLLSYCYENYKQDHEHGNLLKELSVNNEIYQLFLAKFNSTKTNYYTAYKHLVKAHEIISDIDNPERVTFFEFCKEIEYFNIQGARTKAEKGCKNAQLYIGYLYEQGVCTTKNDDEAIMWYNLSHKNGSKEASKKTFAIVKDKN